MPPTGDQHCRYVAADRRCRYVREGAGTKLRWGLSVDSEELKALKVFAEACETTVVTCTAAP